MKVDLMERLRTHELFNDALGSLPANEADVVKAYVEALVSDLQGVIDAATSVPIVEEAERDG